MRTTNRLGCLTGTGIIAALLTAMIIVGFAYARGGLMYNPGPLSTHGDEILGGVRSHAEIGGKCDACHSAPWDAEIMADRCVDCHGAIAVQMKDVASVHGALIHDNPQLGCRHCHPEHRGADAKLTELGDAAFPHEVVGFSLNAHQLSAAREPFTCADCHADDITTFQPDTCDTCHRQFDVGFMTAHKLSYGGACMDCHDGVDRFDDRFNHDLYPFRIKGKHVGLACDQCHYTARTFSDFETTPEGCSACHLKDDAHAGRLGSNCVDCHSENGWTPATFDHDLAAFKLVGEHAEADCESCHSDRRFVGTPQDCYSCHQKDDEHEGQFGADCSACHTPFNWESDFDHNKTRFALVSSHSGLTCDRCHSSGQFAGLPRACVNCHGDPAYHSGMFGLNCAGCHTIDNWRARYDGPHRAIDRHHEGASCRDCHQQTLHSATCSACHDGNPGREDGGDGDGGGD